VGQLIDLLLTDPPYNVNYKGATKSRKGLLNDNMSAEKYQEFLTAAFSNAYEYMREGASFYVWYAYKSQDNVFTALKASKLNTRQVLIWNKNQFVLGWSDYHQKHEPCLYGWKEGAPHKWYSDRKQTTVLNFKKPTTNKLHPTMKPVEMMQYLISNSTKEGDKVLDLFGGSGSTLIACEELNRQCYTMELDEKYCETIIERWETLTGKKALLCE
jgi:site-specific DNA-methyltransferase (adenine-specific)